MAGSKLVALCMTMMVILAACSEPRSSGVSADHSAAEPPAPAYDNSEAMAAAIDRFQGLPGIRHVEWLDGDFIIAAVDNGKSWQPVAESSCHWIRSHGMRGEFSVNVLEAGALLNRKWTQLAHARCN